MTDLKMVVMPVQGSPRRIKARNQASSQLALLLFVLTDEDRTVLPVISEESPQPFWNASDCSMYCTHPEERPV